MRGRWMTLLWMTALLLPQAARAWNDTGHIIVAEIAYRRLNANAKARIEPLLGPVRALVARGLITLERARLLEGDLGAAPLPGGLAEAAKLTIQLGRRERAAGAPAFAAVCDLLHRAGFDAATALLGVDGTRRGRRARARFFAANREVPLVVAGVGAGQHVGEVLPLLGSLLDDPVVTLERARICKRDGVLLATPHELPATDEHGLALWQKLSVHSSQAATAGGRALHVELIRRLRDSGAAGVTAMRGFWGFSGGRAPHGDRLFQLRRDVPVVTVAIDEPQRAERSFEIIDELTREHGLVTSEMVPALSAPATRGGLELARHRL